MQAFGHQLDSNASASMYDWDGSVSTGGEIAPDHHSTDEEDIAKLQQAMFLSRYRPESGRADRLAANIPGGHTSSWGGNGDHLTGSKVGGGDQ